MYKQLVTPNLNTRAQMGMCLEYVQNAFGSGWAGSYALEGWKKVNKVNHANHDIPSGVYVPIWFSGMWNGFNYGHVAIYKDGKIYSSPYTNKTTHDTLGSIVEVERIYGMSFIGWSEDIGGTRVIIPAGDDMIEDTQREYDEWAQDFEDATGRAARTGKKLSRTEFRKSFVGKTASQARETIRRSPEVQTWNQLAKLGIKAKAAKPSGADKKLEQAKKLAQQIAKL